MAGRTLLFGVVAVLLFFSVELVQAGDVVRFNAPKYRGIPWDWCKTWATDCGKPAAHDFCHRQGYSHAVRYGTSKMKRTAVVGSNKVCKGNCGGFTYVDCARGQQKQNKRSYGDCLNRYCPMCARAISLLNQSADPKCEACKKAKAGAINRCMQGK